MTKKKIGTGLKDNLPKGEVLVYQTDDGRIKLDVRLEDETVWLTQQLIAELFQTTVPNISMQIHNIYDEGELSSEATVKKFLTVRRDGDREVRRELDFFNLDMIISVGYRVKSLIATRFHIWATQRLKEYIVKGFTMDDERLKNPPMKGFIRDYPKSVISMACLPKQSLHLTASIIPAACYSLNFSMGINSAEI
jgi:hypothetical protein